MSSQFFQMAMKMVDLHLSSSGTFYQSGVGFGYFSMVAASRFRDLSFGRRLYNASQQLLRRFNDPHTLGRGLTVLSLFVAHLMAPIRDNFDMQEEAMEYGLMAGDKHSFLFSVAGLALSRLYLGADMADLESYCSIASEDFGNWAADLRGGILLTAVRWVYSLTFDSKHILPASVSICLIAASFTSLLLPPPPLIPDSSS